MQMRLEATIVARGVHWRCITASEAARLADKWIACLDGPPLPVIDISLAGGWHEGEVLPLFDPLLRGMAETELIPETLGMLSATIEEHPERIGSVCVALWDLEFSRRLPDNMVGARGAMPPPTARLEQAGAVAGLRTERPEGSKSRSFDQMVRSAMSAPAAQAQVRSATIWRQMEV